MKLGVGLAVMLLAGPVAAEPCGDLWRAVVQAAPVVMSGTVATEGEWCVIGDVVLDMPGEYAPDWHADRLRIRGGALPWLAALATTGAGGGAVPDRLEMAVEGLRLVVRTGDAQMDYLFAAQARASTINGALALAWDAPERVLRLEALTVDFPGENALAISGVVRGVDLSSTGAMQMSATGFAVTEVDLSLVMNGFVEWYLLLPLGQALLPLEGDMELEVSELKTQVAQAIGGLPGASFSDKTKGAMMAFVRVLPNPAGTLTVALRSEAGVGPARALGYVMTGIPRSTAEAAPAFDGVVIEVEWQDDAAQ